MIAEILDAVRASCHALAGLGAGYSPDKPLGDVDLAVLSEAAKHVLENTGKLQAWIDEEQKRRSPKANSKYI